MRSPSGRRAPGERGELGPESWAATRGGESRRRWWKHPSSARGGCPYGRPAGRGAGSRTRATPVLAYRSVAIWLPAPVGLAALGGLRRTLAGWTPAAA